MKLFKFFLIENFLVVGLPHCRIPRGIKQWDDWGCNQRYPDLFEPSRPSRNEIAAPIASKINGIEMTELAFHQMKTSQKIRGRRSFKAAELFPPIAISTHPWLEVDNECTCGKGNYMNLDANDGTGAATGTGDHESFK